MVEHFSIFVLHHKTFALKKLRWQGTKTIATRKMTNKERIAGLGISEKDQQQILKGIEMHQRYGQIFIKVSSITDNDVTLFVWQGHKETPLDNRELAGKAKELFQNHLPEHVQVHVRLNAPPKKEKGVPSKINNFGFLPSDTGRHKVAHTRSPKFLAEVSTEQPPSEHYKTFEVKGKTHYLSIVDNMENAEWRKLSRLLGKGAFFVKVKMYDMGL